MIPENKKKVLLITNIPNPYRISLFNELNKQLKRKEISLKVLFGAMSYPRRKWEIDMTECQFEYEVLPSRKIPLFNAEHMVFTYRGILKEVKKENPKAIVTIGFSVATMKLWFMSFFSLPPYYIWTGSTGIRGRSYSYLRKLQRKLLISRASGFITYGTKAKDYLANLGVEPEKIHISFNTTDIKYYIDKAKSLRDRMEKERERKTLLYLGYITKRKRLDLLLSAIKKLSLLRQDFILKVVGSGPEMDNMKIFVSKLGIEDFVIFEGYKQKEEIPLYLAQADCFLFPSSYDVWGLVLVEAMSVGLPCISSIFAGATSDLIVEGVTGFAMNFADSVAVSERINWILENPKLSNEIGQKASKFVAEKLSLEKGAMSFVRLLQEI